MIELHNQVRAPRLETANQRHGAFHRFKPCPIAAPFGSLATSAPAICRCQRRERTLPLPYRSVPLSQSSSLRWNCPETMQLQGASRVCKSFDRTARRMLSGPGTPLDAVVPDAGLHLALPICQCADRCPGRVLSLTTDCYRSLRCYFRLLDHYKAAFL